MPNCALQVVYQQVLHVPRRPRDRALRPTAGIAQAFCAGLVFGGSLDVAPERRR